MSEYFFPTKKAHYQKQADNARCFIIKILQQWIKLRESEKLIVDMHIGRSLCVWLIWLSYLLTPESGYLAFSNSIVLFNLFKMFSFPISERSTSK
jgi:hypothetical protein